MSGCGDATGDVSADSTKHDDSNSIEDIKKDEASSNIEAMVQVMENFHAKCIGESPTFRASGERTLLGGWDRQYPKEDVDKAIEILLPTLMTDKDIYRELKFGVIISTVLTMSQRVIK